MNQNYFIFITALLNYLLNISIHYLNFITFMIYIKIMIIIIIINIIIQS